MRRRIARAALASLLGLGAGGCANIWGFADLTSENLDAAQDSQAPSGDASDGQAGDGPVSSGGDSAGDAAPDGSIGCTLANSSICRGLCPGNATPCGCVPDPSTRTTYCAVVGTGRQGSGCSSDTDCGPGFGCLMPMATCAHWCRMGSTTCPTNTTCQSTPSVTYNMESFYYCY